jgi:hypothetical protein
MWRGSSRAVNIEGHVRRISGKQPPTYENLTIGLLHGNNAAAELLHHAGRVQAARHNTSDKESENEAEAGKSHGDFVSYATPTARNALRHR